eukprot:4048-Karenia_brevis.AAC.1
MSYACGTSLMNQQEVYESEITVPGHQGVPICFVSHRNFLVPLYSTTCGHQCQPWIQQSLLADIAIFIRSP